MQELGNAVKEHRRRAPAERIIDGSALTIAMLGESAQSMLASATEIRARLAARAMGDACGPLLAIAEEQADSLWNNLGQIALMLADRRSADVNDLRAKIGVWRKLAPESYFSEKEQTPDEALLCSIIDDFERMAA